MSVQASKKNKNKQTYNVKCGCPTMLVKWAVKQWICNFWAVHGCKQTAVQSVTVAFLPFLLSEGVVSHRLLSADTVQQTRCVRVCGNKNEGTRKQDEMKIQTVSSASRPGPYSPEDSLRWAEISLFCHSPMPCLFYIFSHPPSPFALHFYRLIPLLSLLSVDVKQTKASRVNPDEIFKIKTSSSDDDDYYASCIRLYAANVCCCSP